MSTTGIKLLAATTVGIGTGGEPAYITTYKCSVPVSGHEGGQIETAALNLTESTFNLAVQSNVADKANLETEGVENFSGLDVFGGRI